MAKKESASYVVSRRAFLTGGGSILSVAPMLAGGRIMKSPVGNLTGLGETPAPIRQNHAAWWREEGLVMAGVDWESLLERVRAGGNPDLPQAYRNYGEKIAVWRHEHSEAVARRLKEMGFNFLMIPFYKGGGLRAEQTSMDDAKSFTEICHRLNLRVGCYTFSGTILYESMLAEDPDARDWFTLDHNGKRAPYGSQYFRRWANRSHPGLRALMRELVHFAVKEAKVDLIHFDNYIMGPGYEAYSVNQFRQYLRSRYTPEERTRRFGFADMDYIQPPPPPPQRDEYNTDPVYQDFVDYRCEVLAGTYRELAEYARSLNPEVVVECNPAGYVGELNSSLGIGSVDHTRVLQWGGAFWDEVNSSRIEAGVLTSRFRSHMLGRYFNNMVFEYTSDRVAMAESMANNLQCLGCLAWVTGDRIAPSAILYGGARDFDPAVLASIRFFRREQRYYQDTEVIADVGVLNTYANTAYGPSITRKRWAAFTQALYQAKVPFTLVPGRYPGDLSRFRALVLADLALISDELLKAIQSYVERGGGLLLTGQATLFDDHGYRRKQAGLAGLFTEPLADKVLHARSGNGRAAYVPQIAIPDNFRLGVLPENREELLQAVRWAVGGPLQVEVRAPETVTMSLYSQPGERRILHLVNYDKVHPVSDIEVILQLPMERRVTSVNLLSPDSGATQALSAQQKGCAVRFVVPRLEVYNLVVIEQ